MTGADPKRRSWRRRFLACLVAGLAAFAVGEVLVRIAVGAPLRERLPVLTVRANPVRGWEMVPGLHYTYEHPVVVNALGLRGPELEPKAEGELRVLVLGDSLTYGQGVADDETLPAWLERDLREREPGRTVRVVNAGLRAYDTRQELALLAELGDTIAPDVVVLCWYWNDFFGRDLEATCARLQASGPVAFDTGTRIEGWETVKWRARQALRASALVMLLHDLTSGLWTEKYDAQDFERGFAALALELARFFGLCRGLDALPLVVVIPDPRALGEKPGEPGFAARVLELARERGLAAVDLAPALREAAARTGFEPVLPFDGHYSSAGNRVLAAPVADAVLALLEAAENGERSAAVGPRSR
jgi:lysophospholipase L1-like esterase